MCLSVCSESTAGFITRRNLKTYRSGRMNLCVPRNRITEMQPPEGSRQKNFGIFGTKIGLFLLIHCNLGDTDKII